MLMDMSNRRGCSARAACRQPALPRTAAQQQSAGSGRGKRYGKGTERI